MITSEVLRPRPERTTDAVNELRLTPCLTPQGRLGLAPADDALELEPGLARRLRETFRVHQYDLAQPVDLVLVARASIVGHGLADVEKDFLTTLRKAGLLKS